MLAVELLEVLEEGRGEDNFGWGLLPDSAYPDPLLEQNKFPIHCTFKNIHAHFQTCRGLHIWSTW